MASPNSSFYILHVSDFHLNEKPEDLRFAEDALDCLTQTLRKEKIQVDYLLHTGDVINASDLGSDSEGTPGNCDKNVKKIVEDRFSKAAEVIQNFASNLNIPMGHVAICCGNHDVIRENPKVKCTNHDGHSPEPDYMTSFTSLCEYTSEDNPPLMLLAAEFEDFLDTINAGNSRKRNRPAGTDPAKKIWPVTCCQVGKLNLLILNTNWIIPKGKKGFCVNCEMIRRELQQAPHNTAPDPGTLNVVMAHKPLYELCETALLPYERFVNTPFMSALLKFVGPTGVYFCGDKHTPSLIRSQIHNIPHYMGGYPIRKPDREPTDSLQIEYNLIQVVDGQIGMERKVHLTYAPASPTNGTSPNASESEAENTWTCRLRPRDDTVSVLYDQSKHHIIKNSFEILDILPSCNSWETVSQCLYQLDENENGVVLKKNIDTLCKCLCQFLPEGKHPELWPNGPNILDFIRDRLNTRMVRIREQESAQAHDPHVTREPISLMEFRGEYGASKSTILGVFYLYLIHQYSKGVINFIPAYFNMENQDILKQIRQFPDDGSDESENRTYYSVAKKTFSEFTHRIQEIAEKENQLVCYLIDGIDEKDCWSRTSEDSVGRGIIDVLSQYHNSCYTVAYSTQDFPYLKNTMPIRKSSEKSDIIQFISHHVEPLSDTDRTISDFILSMLKFPNIYQLNTHSPSQKDPKNAQKEEAAANAILEAVMKFRRISINSAFMYLHRKFFNGIICSDENGNSISPGYTLDDIYRYYLEFQNKHCMRQLGYGFVNYAPAMAYMFAFRGFTYEKFMHLDPGPAQNPKHEIKLIIDNQSKIYEAFQFIRKNADAREYLIAMHYNRELRYYAEHPDQSISADSILNEFIGRNISIMIRKYWTDIDKFKIVCEALLKRKTLGPNLIGMLIYCIAHQDKMYAPIRCELQDQLLNRGNALLPQNDDPQKLWTVTGDNAKERLDHFLMLSLRYNLTIYGTRPNKKLFEDFADNDAFCRYNRQYQMLYYGDLAIRGEAFKNPLIPEEKEEVIYDGLDFYHCFQYQCLKLDSDDYPLREYDLCSLADLLFSRLNDASKQDNGTRFFNSCPQDDMDPNYIIDKIIGYITAYNGASLGQPADPEKGFRYRTSPECAQYLAMMYHKINLCRKSIKEKRKREEKAEEINSDAYLPAIRSGTELDQNWAEAPLTGKSESADAAAK